MRCARWAGKQNGHGQGAHGRNRLISKKAQNGQPAGALHHRNAVLRLRKMVGQLMKISRMSCAAFPLFTWGYWIEPLAV